MATQGLIDILKDGKMYIKIVVGCNGYNASKVAAEICQLPNIKPREAYDIAKRLKFGCDDCRVVVYRTGRVDKCPDTPSTLYRSTFYRLKFNPRWEEGYVGEYALIDFKEAEK